MHVNLTGNTKTLLKPSKLEIIHFMTIFVSEIKLGVLVGLC